MKKPPTKNELRQRLERQTAAFLSGGGKVREFDVGESAYDRSDTPPAAPLFEAQKTANTSHDLVPSLTNCTEALAAFMRGGGFLLRAKMLQNSFAYIPITLPVIDLNAANVSMVAR